MLQKLIENRISIYDAFKSNIGDCCIARWKKSTLREEYNVIKSELLLDEDLPKPTIFLDDDGESIEYLEKVKNRINQIFQSKLDIYLESEEKEQLQMAQISIKDEYNDYPSAIFDIDYYCNITTNIVVSHRKLNSNFAMLVTNEDNSNNVCNDNLAAA